jgi:hypothetical protein
MQSKSSYSKNGEETHLHKDPGVHLLYDVILKFGKPEIIRSDKDLVLMERWLPGLLRLKKS